MTRRTRTVVAAMTLWLVIVAGTSTAAWLVIDRAGREVFTTTEAAGSLEPAPTTPPVTTDAPTSTTPPPRSSPTTGAPKPSSTRPAPRPTTSARSSSTPRPTSTPSAPQPSPTPAKTSPPPPATVSDSITVSGGTLGVSCQGSTITLRYVTPRNGWSYELHRESRTIEVKFSRQGGGGESEVHATCSGGRPVFEQDSGDGGGSDGSSGAGSD